MSRFPFSTLVLIALIALLATLATTGCGNSRRGEGARTGRGDSGSLLRDGGTTEDGGEDGGTREDSGAHEDSGIAPDSGAIGDAGSCPSPRRSCEEACVDTQTNRDHCGECFNGCGSDETCRSGSCIPPECTASCGDASCGSDGCGGSCGTCGSGEACTSSRRCEVVSTPGGESCSSAVAVTSSVSFTFGGWAPTHTPFSCGNSDPRPDLVYVYTAPRSGTVTATTQSLAGADTMLAVFSSVSCAAADEVNCNDDTESTEGGLGSVVTFSVTSGARYYLVVAPYETPVPTETITLTVTSPSSS